MRINQIKLINLILAFGFFQQVLVINVGGSVRLSDLLCLIGGVAVVFNQKKFRGLPLIILFAFFVISPLIGQLLAIIKFTDFNRFYAIFGKEASGLRYDRTLASIIIYLYYLIVFLYAALLSTCELNEFNFKKLTKTFIFAGLFTCTYSLYGFLIVRGFGAPDLIPSFLDSRNNTPISEVRPSGFSSEAGDLSFMLVWVLFLLTFQKKLFSSGFSFASKILVTITLIASFSSGIVSLFISIIFYNIFWNRNFLPLVWTILFGLIVVGIALNNPAVAFVLHQKILKVFEGMMTGAFPVGSAGIRGYHWYLGLELFKDNMLFGVGGGGSYFHLWRYDIWGEAELDGPKNLYIKVASETGLFGVSLLFIFYYIVIRDALRLKKIDAQFSSLLFISLLYFSLSITALSTIYSLWVWMVFLLIFFRGQHILRKHRLSENSSFTGV